MSIKHVLFVLTNTAHIGPNQRSTGYFFPEVAHPYEVFAEAGVAVEYASLLGGTPPEDGYDETDPAQLAFRNSSAIRRMSRSRKLSEVDVLDYDAVFFPGGLGPRWSTSPTTRKSSVSWNAPGTAARSSLRCATALPRCWVRSWRTARRWSRVAS
jgi:hypothetical protein